MGVPCFEKNMAEQNIAIRKKIYDQKISVIPYPFGLKQKYNVKLNICKCWMLNLLNVSQHIKHVQYDILQLDRFIIWS